MLPVNGLYGHIQKNALKSVLLLASFTVLVALFFACWCVIYVAIADYVTYRYSFGHHHAPLTVERILSEGAQCAWSLWWVPLLGTAGWFVFAYVFHGDLIASATGASPVSRTQEPKLYNLVENLSITAGLPVPRIEIMETDALNAYAAGLSPKTAVVCVTRGLLDALTKDELEAVLAHEITHIVNRDIRLMAIATVFVSGLTLIGPALADMLPDGLDLALALRLTRRSRGKDSDGSGVAVVVAIGIAVIGLALTHVMALLVNFAISRAREFMADAGSAQLTKNPDALVSALNRLAAHDEIPGLPENLSAMMISADASSLFATHPPLAERVSALQRYAGARKPARVADAPALSFGRPAPAGSLGFAGTARTTFGKRGRAA